MEEISREIERRMIDSSAFRAGSATRLTNNERRHFQGPEKLEGENNNVTIRTTFGNL